MSKKFLRGAGSRRSPAARGAGEAPRRREPEKLLRSIEGLIVKAQIEMKMIRSISLNSPPGFNPHPVTRCEFSPVFEGEFEVRKLTANESDAIILYKPNNERKIKDGPNQS
jgi:hypothetical protein